MEHDEALARLRSARVGRLATLTPEGKPHVVPLVFVVMEQGSATRLYWMVDEKPKRSKELQRLRNIEHQPAVELVVDEYDEDWATLWWVRARGTARVVVEAGERDAALESRGWKREHTFEIPQGPVCSFRTPGGHRIALYELTRPDAVAHFAGRRDF